MVLLFKSSVLVSLQGCRSWMKLLYSYPWNLCTYKLQLHTILMATYTKLFSIDFFNYKTIEIKICRIKISPTHLKTHTVFHDWHSTPTRRDVIILLFRFPRNPPRLKSKRVSYPTFGEILCNFSPLNKNLVLTSCQL